MPASNPELRAPRVLAAATGSGADANVRPRHPADTAAWIWHPRCRAGETAFLRFTLEFELPAAAAVQVHVSADQRYQLQCDGEDVGRGPDRGHVNHWPVAGHCL